MKVRGERECKDCGTRWSYYETGTVACPACESLRSVGVDDDRRLHTDAPAELDLTEAREAVDDSLREAADRAAELAREYVRKRGFVDAGELAALDDRYLAATELRHAAGTIGRRMDPDDDEEWYFLALLRGADADEPDRPAPDEVPASMRGVRGLAYANAVREYRREMADWLDEQGGESRDRSVLETLGSHVKRVRALDGEVDPDDAEWLAAAARDAGRYLREGDDEALASARERLDRLAD
jgi:uncharacterized Zn finger protein (UPF0148 family)